MLPLAGDENFDGRIVRGLLRVLPETDLVRVQDTPLAGADDEVVLQWASEEGRLLLTHDRGTMTAAAWARVRDGRPMPGLIEVSGDAPIGRTIEELRLIIETCSPGELEGQVLFLPL